MSALTAEQVIGLLTRLHQGAGASVDIRSSILTTPPLLPTVTISLPTKYAPLRQQRSPFRQKTPRCFCSIRQLICSVKALLVAISSLQRIDMPICSSGGRNNAYDTPHNNEKRRQCIPRFGFSEEKSAELILKSNLLQALQGTIKGRGGNRSKQRLDWGSTRQKYRNS